MAPYDEWKCRGMPFSYDQLTIDLGKKLRNAKKSFENKLTKILGRSSEELRKILRCFENRTPGVWHWAKRRSSAAISGTCEAFCETFTRKCHKTSHYRPNVKVIVRFKIANIALAQMCVFNTKLIAVGNKMAIFIAHIKTPV